MARIISELELAKFFADSIVGWPFGNLYENRKNRHEKYRYNSHSPEWTAPTQEELLDAARSFLEKYSVVEK